jgi:hypothetical protein
LNKKSLISLITICVFLSLSFGEYESNNSGNLFIASSNTLDGNNISAWFRNNGSFNRNPSTDNSGFNWPNGTNFILRFASGLWLGAKVENDTLVAVATYSYEYYPGYIDLSGNPQGKDDPQYRVYKIIKGDTLSSDYLNWPVSQGAYNGENGKPFLPGTQTIFYSMTDGYPESHGTPGGITAPLKAQVQVTSWCYNDYPPTELRNVIFSEFKIINKNNLPWNEAFITIWSDECSYENIAIGCDSILNLGYSYYRPNSQQYGSNPPALAFLLLQGPDVYTGNSNDTVYSFVPGQSQRTVKIGYKELKLSSFSTYQNATPPGQPYTYQQTYLTMHGYKSDGTSWINPLNNSVTKFPFSGDPETGTGWNQYSTNGYGNRRLQMNIGELNINPGDTQTIVVAQIVSQGSSNLNSVTKLKQSAVYVADVFNNNFTTVGIKENVSDGIISDYKLYQNYPNPFNPTTKINYELRVTNYVSVIVYDILGNEVETLVNEKKLSGSYEVEFSGSNLPSGIYFYSLSIDGNLVDTKRMILLK